jgi:hypothetical protein
MRLLWLIPLVGCTGTEAVDTEQADTDTDTDTDADSDADTDADADLASLNGTVTDPAGNPVEGARVNVCRLVCQTRTTDVSGQYVYDATLGAQTSSFYVFPPDGTSWVTPMITVTLAADEVRTLDVPLSAPTDQAPIPDIAAEVELSGLLLTVGKDTLEPAEFTTLPDDIVVAYRSDNWLPIETPGTVVAVWYLSPFEATSEQGLPLRIQDQWDLPQGGQYEVYAASTPANYTWFDLGTLTVGADGVLDGDVTVPLLTTLALVDPS